MAGSFAVFNPTKKRGGKKKRAKSAKRSGLRSAKAMAKRAFGRRGRRALRTASRKLDVNYFVSQGKDALLGATGALGTEFLWAKLNPNLPDMVRVVPGKPGAGDAVRAVVVAAAGRMLAPKTRGLSAKLATGALTVQFYGLVRNMLPADIKNQMGYVAPAMIVQGQPNISPNRVRQNSMQRYTQPGATPLLNRYTRPGATPLLSGMVNMARQREGITVP